VQATRSGIHASPIIKENANVYIIDHGFCQHVETDDFDEPIRSSVGPQSSATCFGGPLMARAGGALAALYSTNADFTLVKFVARPRIIRFRIGPKLVGAYFWSAEQG
jgi:hypothetical protein